MTDYYPVIARAVSGLTADSPQARQQLYERARKIVDAELHSRNPPIPAPEMLRQHFALENAIRKVEAESTSLSLPTVKAREIRSEKPKDNRTVSSPTKSSPTNKIRQGFILSWVAVSAVWCTYIAVHAYRDYKTPPPRAPIQEQCRDIVVDQFTSIPPECLTPIPDETFDALRTPVRVYAIIGLVPPITLFGLGAIFHWMLSRSPILKER
jgi:hypothetical protein